MQSTTSVIILCRLNVQSNVYELNPVHCIKKKDVWTPFLYCSNPVEQGHMRLNGTLPRKNICPIKYVNELKTLYNELVRSHCNKEL